MRCIAFVAAALVGAATAAELPEDLETFDDGRASIHDLYDAYLSLATDGWRIDYIAESKPAGTDDALPVLAFLSPHRGPATWIISGIHGEEPAGPNGIARAIDSIAALGREQAVVLIPLANPHGYIRNWRYLNSPTWSEGVDSQSVGDSSHLLPDESAGRARVATPSSAEAGLLTRYIVDRMSDYPPRISIDLHEDNLIDEGYVYSQGNLGAGDPLAAAAIRILASHDIPLKRDGTTRFDETITDGIIGPVADSSIDELMSAAEIIVDGKLQPGPAAETVLVFETPAGALSLEQRVAAHSALLKELIGRIAE